jgi:stage II sporulation protein GA (sporulation sigma-E factor processing peptidase)
MLLAGFCIFIEFSNSGNLTFSYKMLDFSYTGILTAVLTSYVIIHRLVIYIKDRREITKLIYDVDIIFDNKVKRVKAFLDTGNELREPATNLPVMIVERYILNDIDLKKNRMFYIPYKVVDGSHGVLTGFKPSSVNIYCEDTFSSKELIVAFSDTKLSDLNDFNALLSRGII